MNEHPGHTAIPPRRGVPVWALLSICFAASFFAFLAGTGIGFVTGVASQGGFADDDQELALEGISIDARVESAGAEAAQRDLPTLVVVVSNSLDRERTLDALDIYHTLVRPEEIVEGDPMWERALVYDNERDDQAYTAFLFEGLAIPPNGSTTLRFEINPDTEGRRDGFVDVYTDGSQGWLSVRVAFDAHAPGSPSPQPDRGPGF